VGGVATRREYDGSRPARSRPHWWVVLAVSLSLLAVVAAVAAGRPHPLGEQPGPRTHAALGPSRAGPASSTTTTTSTTVRSSQTPATSPVAGPAPTSAPVTDARVSSGPVVTTTTSTVAASPARGSNVAAAPVQPVVPTESYPGYLQQPDDATANYSFSGQGSMEVSASWTSSSILSLTVTCPAGTQTDEGPSPVTVVLPDADGACGATLKETIVQYDEVPYTLTIGPAEGG
jgi:hypothetical protein